MAEVQSQMKTAAPPIKAAPVAAAKPSGIDPTKPQTVPTSRAPFQIQPVSVDSRWLKIMIYGKHGVGKSVLAGSAADVVDMSDVLYVDAEAGDLSLVDSGRIEDVDAIMKVSADKFKTVGYVQHFLKAHCAARDANDEQKLRKLQSDVTGVPPDEIERVYKFRTIVIDSLYELEQMCMNNLLGLNTSDVLLDPDKIDVAEWPQFRKNYEMIKTLIRAFRDLPIHLIVVCPDQWNQDEMKKFHYSPRLTGKLSAQVQGFFDVVGFLVANQANSDGVSLRRLYVQPIAIGGVNFDAKCRRGSFKEPFFDNPTMLSMMKGFGLVK